MQSLHHIDSVAKAPAHGKSHGYGFISFAIKIIAKYLLSIANM